MKVQSFRELEVWRIAMELSRDVYAILRQFPQEERYALCDQIRRSAVSIPSNIAEGFGRESTKDFMHFISMARGSLYELDTQLELAELIGFTDASSKLREKIDRTGMMLNALSARLKSRLEPRPATNESRITNHEPRK